MTSFPQTRIPTNTFPEDPQIRPRTRTPPSPSQSQMMTIKNASANTERLRYHLRLQLASVVDPARNNSHESRRGWQFVPPCLISTTSGALSPQIFHKSLEKIHCDSTLYPHLEEESAPQEVAYESDDPEQSWHSTMISIPTPLSIGSNASERLGRHDPHANHIVVEVVRGQKGPRRLEAPEKQYGATFLGPNVCSPQDHSWNPRNPSRGRLASSRRSFFNKEWHCDAQLAEDRGPLLPAVTTSWDYYSVTDNPFEDFEREEDGEKLLVVGSYFAVVGLVLLSFWVLTHHNHLH